ncbi:hypothetical protein Vadar_015064 [Vaccinium darrowii]|uniref:Uncharacterized protein n=1 Tax=Vaccinium darrowii TaxID=229202 RepID=A0ACB7XHJ6_9ERIC|nr:hypothetical protein Vadar_015064 [Vaccinium darrowii]
MHNSCFEFLRLYAVDSYSNAACSVAPKALYFYPQGLIHCSSSFGPLKFGMQTNEVGKRTSTAINALSHDCLSQISSSS